MKYGILNKKIFKTSYLSYRNQIDMLMLMLFFLLTSIFIFIIGYSFSYLLIKVYCFVICYELEYFVIFGIIILLIHKVFNVKNM